MNRQTGGLLRVVLRGRRRERIDGIVIDIIEAHNAVQEADGRVALAKFGRAPSPERVHVIRRALESGSAIESRPPPSAPRRSKCGAIATEIF